MFSRGLLGRLLEPPAWRVFVEAKRRVCCVSGPLRSSMFRSPFVGRRTFVLRLINFLQVPKSHFQVAPLASISLEVIFCSDYSSWWLEQLQILSDRKDTLPLVPIGVFILSDTFFHRYHAGGASFFGSSRSLFILSNSLALLITSAFTLRISVLTSG